MSIKYFLNTKLNVEFCKRAKLYFRSCWCMLMQISVLTELFSLFLSLDVIRAVLTLSRIFVCKFVWLKRLRSRSPMLSARTRCVSPGLSLALRGYRPRVPAEKIAQVAVPSDECVCVFVVPAVSITDSLDGDEMPRWHALHFWLLTSDRDSSERERVREQDRLFHCACGKTTHWYLKHVLMFCVYRKADFHSLTPPHSQTLFQLGFHILICDPQQWTKCIRKAFMVSVSTWRNVLLSTCADWSAVSMRAGFEFRLSGVMLLSTCHDEAVCRRWEMCVSNNTSVRHIVGHSGFCVVKSAIIISSWFSKAHCNGRRSCSPII